MNIPIYRARRIDSDEYKIGQLTNLVIPDIERISNDEQKDIEREAYFITKGSLCKNVGNSFEYCGENRFVYMISELNEIDPTTLAIHFEDMLDSQGNKIFASLSEDGKGGDIVEGKCRDVNGDTITRLHKPLPYKGLVRFYKETLMSVVIETKDEIIEETKGWNTPIYVNRGEALRWCDCRQDIKVLGIQE